ncbi:MAG: hypothetical protein N4A74_15720 [Carboxylicivirga sp.]|jgi:hypothetical protein|nr:hypothetical protein [Carboxylicivirga sp.]
MRHFILLIYLLTTICACTKQNTFKDNDLVKRNLIGDVKHIKTKFYEVAYSNDSLVVTDTISSQGSDQSNYIEFNKQGNITYLKEYNREVKCQYNENKLLEHVVISDFFGKESTKTYDYFYNKSDSVVKIIIKNNRERSILNMQRDHIGRLVKRIELKGDSVHHTYERIYDNNGNILNENTYYGTNKPYILISRKYDSQSELKEERIKHFTYDSDLDYNCIRVFTKDQNNRVLKIKESYGCDTIYAKIIKKYNENDILIDIIGKTNRANFK